LPTAAHSPSRAGAGRASRRLRRPGSAHIWGRSSPRAAPWPRAVRWAGESRGGKAAPVAGTAAGRAAGRCGREEAAVGRCPRGSSSSDARSLSTKPRPCSPPPAPGPGERWRCRGLSTRNCCRQPHSTAQTKCRSRLQVSLLRSTGVQARVMLGSAGPRFLQGGSVRSQPSPAAVTAPWSVTSQRRAACSWAPGWAFITISLHQPVTVLCNGDRSGKMKVAHLSYLHTSLSSVYLFLRHIFFSPVLVLMQYQLVSMSSSGFLSVPGAHSTEVHLLALSCATCSREPTSVGLHWGTSGPFQPLQFWDSVIISVLNPYTVRSDFSVRSFQQEKSQMCLLLSFRKPENILGRLIYWCFL